MKARELRIAIFTFVFTILIFFNSFSYYSSTYQRTESSTSSGYCKVDSKVILNQLMNLDNIKVNFTQNDTNYTFNVTCNSVVNIKSINSSLKESTCWVDGTLGPLLYKNENFGDGATFIENDKTPFADYSSGTITDNSSVKIQNVELASTYFKGTMNNGEYRSWDSDNTANGEYYYIPNSFRCADSKSSYCFQRATSYPRGCQNNGTGVSLIANNSNYHYSYRSSGSYRYIDNYYANMNISISINKNYIDSYRYLCFGQAYVAISSESSGSLSVSASGYSLCSNTIDLKEYINCEHSWAITNDGNKLSHKKYCDKCKWETREEHNLIYEYDEMQNNMCECKYISQVKSHYIINDDVINEVDEIIDSYSEFNDYAYTHKIGYKFNWYDKYEMQLVNEEQLSTVSNALKKVFISTCSEISGKVDNYSIFYEANYSPISFTFRYSTESNIDKQIDDSISPQIIYYDQKAYLKNNIYVKGYALIGWSLLKGSNIADFLPKQEITNYTSNDLQEYTIYPIYKSLGFKIIYNAGKGKFLDGSRQKVVKCNYFDNQELEKYVVSQSTEHFIAYVDEYGNQFKNMAELKDFVDNLNVMDYEIYLFPKTYRDNYGPPEHTEAGGIVPGETKSVEETIESTNGIDNEFESEIIIEIDETKETENLDDNENKIFKMTDTIIEEELMDEIENKNIATISMTFKKNSGGSKTTKFNLLLQLIKSNKILFFVVISLYLILAIMYEILIIKKFLRN